jgi:hypothetical protein
MAAAVRAQPNYVSAKAKFSSFPPLPAFFPRYFFSAAELLFRSYDRPNGQEDGAAHAHCIPFSIFGCSTRQHRRRRQQLVCCVCWAVRHAFVVARHVTLRYRSSASGVNNENSAMLTATAGNASFNPRASAPASSSSALLPSAAAAVAAQSAMQQRFSTQTGSRRCFFLFLASSTAVFHPPAAMQRPSSAGSRPWGLRAGSPIVRTLQVCAHSCVVFLFDI